jgi:hypothetical protein
VVLAFGPETPVLIPNRVTYRGRLTWLLWPALQYRVVSPLVHEPAVNVFQRALLGLTRAGLRDLTEIARLLGLDAEFAVLVRDDLRTLGYLNEFGVITAAGSTALADGFLDPHRVVVTHVYQEPFTGTLWPATMSAPMLASARWPARNRAELDLGAGRSVPIRPLAIPLDGPQPDPPTADEIVEAVSCGTRAPVWGEDHDGWRWRAPERLTARVSLVTAAQPVYLPVAVIIAGSPRNGQPGTSTWLAFSPFSGKQSPLLRRLIAIQCGNYPALRRTVENLTGRPTETLLADYDKIGADLRAEYRERFERRFGPGLLEHGELIELLTLLELNASLAKLPGQRAAELNAAATAGWRIQEFVLRKIARTYPARQNARPDEQLMPVWQRLMLASERIGLRGTEYLTMSVLETPQMLIQALRNTRQPKTPELLASVLLSADQGGPDHPVRCLAQGRPTLLTDLTRVAQVRNDSAHAELVSIDLDFVKLSYRLACETVAAFLGMPVPDDD